jgi:hypothetical protein
MLVKTIYYDANQARMGAARAMSDQITRSDNDAELRYVVLLACVIPCEFRAAPSRG